ncbi:MAG: hypothetical protein PHE82_08970, partial [Syntrophomonadaceae bacterium]|nr:hypothetical protein [Syntrophomonadaceae bacterium]
MMKYIVIKQFSDMGTPKQPGDYVEADDTRAAKLRRMGLIGGRYELPIQTVDIKEYPKKPAAAKKKKM